MTFEEWRRNEGLSYDALAKRFGLSSATHARRYALGVVEVPADVKEQVIAATDGAVSLADFHAQRLAQTGRRRRVACSTLSEATP